MSDYDLGRHDERRLIMQLIGAVRMDFQAGASGDVLDRLVMSIANHPLADIRAPEQSPRVCVNCREGCHDFCSLVEECECPCEFTPVTAEFPASVADAHWLTEARDLIMSMVADRWDGDPQRHKDDPTAERARQFLRATNEVSVPDGGVEAMRSALRAQNIQSKGIGTEMLHTTWLTK